MSNVVDVSATLHACQSTLHAAFGNQFDSLLNTAIDAGRECGAIAKRHPERFMGENSIAQVRQHRSMFDNDMTSLFLSRLDFMNEEVRKLSAAKTNPELAFAFEYIMNHLFRAGYKNGLKEAGVPESEIATAEIEAQRCVQPAVMAR